MDLEFSHAKHSHAEKCDAKLQDVIVLIQLMRKKLRKGFCQGRQTQSRTHFTLIRISMRLTFVCSFRVSRFGELTTSGSLSVRCSNVQMNIMRRRWGGNVQMNVMRRKLKRVLQQLLKSF